MINLKVEAEKMVESHCENEGCRFDYDLSENIKSLCTRYGDEKVEAAAKVAEKHKTWKYKRGGEDPHYTSCEGCGENIATAIRATKEEKG